MFRVGPKDPPKASPWAAMLLLVIIGAVMGFVIITRSTPWSDSRAEKRPEPPPLAPKAAPVVEKQGPPVVTLGPEATVVYHTKYKTCGRVITSEPQRIPDQMVNLTAEQIRIAYPGWTIQDFRPDRLVLSATRDGLCPDMQKYRYIGIKDGKVAIFYGKPGEGELVKEVTAIEVSRLSPEDQEVLKKGITANGDSDVAAYLEGVLND